MGVLLSTNLWPLVTACIIACAFAVAFKRFKQFGKGSRASATLKDSLPAGRAAPVFDKAQATASRTPGEWSPVEFHYPRVTPFLGKIEDVKPVPYRPFKWGEYFVTMGIRSMLWDEWIELDREFFHYHKIREQRIKTRRDHIVKTLPPTPGLVDGGHAGAAELVQELAEYLSARFPKIYTVVRNDPEKDATGWYGQPSIKEITIVPLQKTYVLGKEDPLVISSLLVQEDLAIMVEGSDGNYYLQAGAVCIAGMWRLEDKIGKNIDGIHCGTVPQFESKLQLSMNRFFKRMPLDKPVVRNNYSFQIVSSPDKADPLDPDELAWAQTMKGDEDVAVGKPGFLRAEAGPYSAANLEKQPEAAKVDPANMRMRVERQTLRRLPRTGAIVFTIRVYVTPVVELAKEPDVPGRMASAIRSWPDDVAKYKARAAFDSILGYLDEKHAEQVAKGITTENP